MRRLISAKEFVIALIVASVLSAPFIFDALRFSIGKMRYDVAYTQYSSSADFNTLQGSVPYSFYSSYNIWEGIRFLLIAYGAILSYILITLVLFRIRKREDNEKYLHIVAQSLLGFIHALLLTIVFLWYGLFDPLLNAQYPGIGGLFLFLIPYIYIVLVLPVISVFHTYAFKTNSFREIMWYTLMISPIVAGLTAVCVYSFASIMFLFLFWTLLPLNTGFLLWCYFVLRKATRGS